MDMLAFCMTLFLGSKKSISFWSVELAGHTRQSKNQPRLNF